MPAYVIANIRVKDPEGYKEYRQLSGPALEAHGGRFLVRGGDSVVWGRLAPFSPVHLDDAAGSTCTAGATLLHALRTVGIGIDVDDERTAVLVEQ